MPDPIRVAMVLFPELTQLDLTAPYEVFARIPGAEVQLVARDAAPVKSEFGLSIAPTATFDTAAPADVLCVPGGKGIAGAIEDPRLIDFLRRQAERASWITAVCTGALVLGAAGLLKGYRATTHWLSVDLLPLLGAIPVEGARVVIDRDRVTAGGVTAGLDFGLAIAERLRGTRVAEQIQLMIEYDPSPPFSAGSPRTAPPDLVEAIRSARRSVQQSRREVLERAMQRLG
ncbi:MAG TPA: DJ-1/PfpI family protein [Myxococcaceae bacterium]|nr:DJ-1/PfpI family protein [Myxococcaceae bacterium]